MRRAGSCVRERPAPQDCDHFVRGVGQADGSKLREEVTINDPLQIRIAAA